MSTDNNCFEMLPIVLYNNMEASSSGNGNLNSSFGQFDENVILNCVRSRKKVSELPNCPVCSCTIRQGELESHVALEVERLHKLSSCSGKRKISVTSGLALPGPSTSPDIDDVPDDQEIDVTGCPGSDVYQPLNIHYRTQASLMDLHEGNLPYSPRLAGGFASAVWDVSKRKDAAAHLPEVSLSRFFLHPRAREEGQHSTAGAPRQDVKRVHGNRLRRLRARRRSPPPAADGECPVCNETLPVSRLQRHALRCLKRTGASVDDLSDSEEEGTIDVEGDESGGGFTEYQWCGEWRVRAAALQDTETRAAVTVRRASNDHALVVDGDEDTELYGPAQYSPSRIAQDVEENAEMDEQTNETNDINTEDKKVEEFTPKPNGLVEASAETRIQALKAKIKDLEQKQNGGSEAKCLICLGAYISPAVSIQCWHVYCEVCWLQSLHAKKICPQCNVITSAQHLRRIYM